jgi:2-oxo-4-hydroxy-4-carboxy-5-ureidoimidazoline decarboxylase
MYKKNIPSQMNKEDFVACFGGVYEHSAWIAEAVWELDPNSAIDENQDTPEGLHSAFRSILDAADRAAKLALLIAHPDLAGKLAISGGLTAESTSEQSSADLGNCTAEEFAAFQGLNEQYKEKFGFPFILAVRGYHRSEILEIFKTRVNNDPATEFNEALTQVHKIALLRLNEIE